MSCLNNLIYFNFNKKFFLKKNKNYDVFEKISIYFNLNSNFFENLVIISNIFNILESISNNKVFIRKIYYFSKFIKKNKNKKYIYFIIYTSLNLNFINFFFYDFSLILKKLHFCINKIFNFNYKKKKIYKLKNFNFLIKISLINFYYIKNFFFFNLFFLFKLSKNCIIKYNWITSYFKNILNEKI